MKILRLKDVLETTGLSKTSIYEFISQGRFPKSIPLGGRSVGWVDSEVENWIKSRIELRDNGGDSL